MSIAHIIILVLLILNSGNTYSQTLNIDSLKKVWRNKTLADTTRLKALHIIAWEGFRFNNPDSAFYYAQLQYELAEKTKNKVQIASALNTQGWVFYNKGDYPTALDYYNKSLGIAKAEDETELIAKITINMGVVYELQGNYVKAMSTYARCLKLFEEIKHQEGVISSLNNIAIIYQIQGDYINAIEYYTRCLKISEEIGAEKVKLTLLNNIGLVYKDHKDYINALDNYNRGLRIAKELDYKPGIGFILNNIGAIYEIQGDNVKALEFFNLSLKTRERIGDKQGIVSCLGHIGSVYKNMGEYNRALDYQNRSLSIAEEIGYQQGIASTLNNIGIIHQLTNKSAQAINYSTRALAKAREIGAVIEVKEAANNLFEAYKKSGNYKLSLDMYQLYVDMRDSIQNIDTQKEVIKQEYRYNYEKQALADSLAFARQRELDTLAQQSKRQQERYALIIGFALVLIFVVVFFRIRFIKNKAERESLLQEIKLLKVKTSVNLTSLITTDEHPQLDKEKIESTISTSLNPSDWEILNALYNNPAIGNKEIADVVSLSVEGVRSSLKKMYRLFDIEKSANQRVLLVMEAAKLSSPVVA